MIFRKPYAFLIKHFKLLHLVLTALMIYLSVKINIITNLFDRLANNYSVALNGLANKYVTTSMYLVIIVIIAVTFVIWFLLNNKKKPNKFYIFLIGYYIILFIFLIIYGVALNTLEEVSMTNQALRVYRDVSLLLPLGQYYFIVISILRGIGFNIKQFNFSKDIKDLEISEEDSEEIEINLSNNTYKYKRFGRKYLRELKYYFFENKYWILLITGCILIIGAIVFFVNFRFVNNNYNQGNKVNASYYNFSVNKTYIAEKNLYGEKVKDGKKYVVVDISIKNNYYEPIPLETKNFRLFIGNDYYYAITNKNSSFKDLGLPYDYKFLDLKNIYNYILIYEVNEDTNINKMKLKVYDSMDFKTSNVEYVNINLKPILLNTEASEQFMKLGEELVVKESNFGNTKIVINDYKFVNNFEYPYEVCVKSDCSEKTGVIVPENILNNKLLVIDYELVLDEKSNLYNYVKNDKDFFNNFVILTYTLNGKEKTILFESINVNSKNKIFMEINKEIENASSIEIHINTRINKYIYKIK